VVLFETSDCNQRLIAGRHGESDGESMAASVAGANVEVLNHQVPDSPAKEVVVPSMTRDRFCRERNLRPAIMKIDVEGAEVNALKGAREVLTGSRPTILCEIHPEANGKLWFPRARHSTRLRDQDQTDKSCNNAAMNRSASASEQRIFL